MSVADGAGGGGLPPGGWWAVETGIKVLGNVISGGPKGPTAADQAALTAAGYRYGAYRGPGNVVEPPKGGKYVPVWINDATGNVIGNRSARGYASRTPPVTSPPVIVNPPSASSGNLPTVRPPPRPPPKQPGGDWNPPPLPRGTPPINPTPTGALPSLWPYVVGSVVGPDIWDWIKRGAIWTYENRQYVPGSRPFPTSTPPPQPGPAPASRGNPFPPQGSPPRVVVNVPERIPRAERVQQAYDELGGDIYVTPKRLPIPAPAPATTPPKPLWLQLLGIAGPLAMSFIRPDQGNRNILRLTDPLTQPQGLTRSEFTNVSSYSAFGGPPGAVGTNTCECKAPRKKGRRKKRTVCYSGTFIERADGTRKTKKRKVKC